MWACGGQAGNPQISLYSEKNKDGLLQNSLSLGTSALEVAAQKRKEPVIQMSSANTENVSQTTLPQ